MEKADTLVPALDVLLSELSVLDSGIVDIQTRQLFKYYSKDDSIILAQDLIGYRKKISDMFERLAELSEGDLEEKSLIQSEIQALRQKLKQIQAVPNPSRTEARGVPNSVEAPRAYPIDILESFDEITAMTPYLIPFPRGNGVMQVVLTAEAIEELRSERIDPRVSLVFLQALKKGVVGAERQRGVKILKTHEGISFAEVKSIGGIAGRYRLFGCIEKKGTIVFHFLGKDMTSSNDPQRDRIKEICK